MADYDPRRLGERLNTRQKWLLLASLMLSMFIGALDQTIMATATPRILADLGGFHLLSWVFTSYLLSSTVAVPLVGKLSDIYGRRTFLLAGVIIFLVASAACGAATSMPQLILFRAVQGLGSGVIFASMFATIGDLFTPAERGRYMGLFTGMFSLASVLGPTVGGLLTDNAGWRWVFYINIPLGLIAIPAIIKNLPATASGRRPRIDFAGATLLTIATVSLLLGLVWAGEEYGWTTPETVALFAIAAVTTVAFLVQESRHPEPILPLHLFRIREFLVANLIVFAVAAGMFGAMSYLPTFVQTALGASATASGLITTPQSLGLLATSVLGGILLTRTGRYRVMTIVGVAIVLASVLLMLTLSEESPKWHVSAFMVVLGLGFGLVMPTLSVVIQNAVPHQYLGVGTSASQFFMQIGSVIGTAVMGLVLASSYDATFSESLSADVRAAVPAATLEKFEDPTLALDEGSYTAVRGEVLALPGGEQLLEGALAAQRTSITAAIHGILLGSAVVMAVALLLTFLLRELPLRRAFGPPAAPPGAEPEPEPGAAPPAAVDLPQGGATTGRA